MPAATTLSTPVPLLSRELHRSAFPKIRAAGLTNAQFWILKWIAVAGPFSMTGLANYLQISSPTVSGMVDELEKRGLLQRTRTQKDRRSVELRVTPKGERLLEQLNRESARVAARAAADIPAANKKVAVRVLALLVRTLESSSAEKRSAGRD
jgi:DNA-binding MarR family transcriptional regulator